MTGFEGLECNSGKEPYRSVWLLLGVLEKREPNTKLLSDLAFGAGLVPVGVSISLSSHGRRGKQASSGLFLKEAIPRMRTLSAWPNPQRTLDDVISFEVRIST